jgi:hypothetical protein
MKDLKQLIRESINKYIKAIDEAGENAACEAKIKAIGEAIELREKKMNKDGLDEVYHDLLDEGKMKELASEVKTLKKSLAKYEKQLAKLTSKSDKGEDNEEKEMIDEDNIDKFDKLKSKASWNDKQRGLTWNSQQLDVDGALEEMTNEPAEGPQLEEVLTPEEEKELAEIEQLLNDDEKAKSAINPKMYEKYKMLKAKKEAKESMNESFLYMQKLAGVITEGQYQAKKKVLNEDVISLTYNTDPDDLEYVKNVLKKAKISAKVKAGTFDDEVEITVDKALRKKAIAALNDAGFDVITEGQYQAKKKVLKEEVEALFEDEIQNALDINPFNSKLINEGFKDLLQQLSAMAEKGEIDNEDIKSVISTLQSSRRKGLMSKQKSSSDYDTKKTNASAKAAASRAQDKKSRDASMAQYNKRKEDERREEDERRATNKLPLDIGTYRVGAASAIKKLGNLAKYYTEYVEPAGPGGESDLRLKLIPKYKDMSFPNAEIAWGIHDK